MKYQPDLYPIDAHLESIFQAVVTNSSIIVKAETGSGKTTRLPPFMVEKVDKKILVLEPRRLAAKLSAQRCQEFLPEKFVGHHVRLDKNISDQTRLIFITEGLFFSYLKQDPNLNDFSLIILDEFHERNVHSDLALALVKRLQSSTRPDLKVIVMSATLETELLETYLEHPVVFDIAGRTFPISIEYQEKTIEEAIVQLVHDKNNSGNTLVFFPGVAEIMRTREKLLNLIPKEIDILPLYSSLSAKFQQKVFENTNTKKIILATNIAETSLTVPNVTAVVDTGVERRASFAAWSGMPLLALTKISKAQAIQRAGRAGRVHAGQVIRLYSEADFHQRENFQPPEIKRIDLSHSLLDLMALGVSPNEFAWPEAPPLENIQRAVTLLEDLEATNDDQLTEIGHFMQELSLHPRMARLLYQADDKDLADLILTASLLSEGSVLNSNVNFTSEDHEVCDLCVQLDLLKAYYFNKTSLSDYSMHFLDLKKTARVFEWYDLIRSRFQMIELKAEKSNPLIIRKRLLTSFNDRVAMKRANSSSKKGDVFYNLCLGRGGVLTTKSSLHATAPDFILVLDALEDVRANAAMGTKIVLASKIELADLLSYSKFIQEEILTNFNQQKGLLELTTLVRYRKLQVKTHKQEPITPKGESLRRLMQVKWPWPFTDDNALKIYNQKVRLLNQFQIEHGCPLYEGEMLELFIESLVDEHTTYQMLLEEGLYVLLQKSLSATDLYTLETMTPDEIILGNGKKLFIDYQKGPIPVLTAQVHDFYGITEHPTILRGACSLQLHMLNPAKRISAQVVDLNRFWQTTWSEVRRELHGRYPKHYWPERPQEAKPVMLKNKL